MKPLLLGAIVSSACSVVTYCLIQRANADLKTGLAIKQTDKLAVNAATCFAWLALTLLLLWFTHCKLRVVGAISLVIVLLYLSLDVKAVHAFVGQAKDFGSSDSLTDRCTQISAAAFAVGSILLNSQKDLAPKVAPLIFLAILLSVSSTITSPSGKQCILRRSSDWEAVQKAAIGIAAGLLALSVGVCIDESLLPFSSPGA